MKIRAGNVGLESLCKRSSKGDAKASTPNTPSRAAITTAASSYAFQLLDGTTAGHAQAAEITRALLRAIFEAVNAHRSERQLAARPTPRNMPTLARFNGATFLATLEVERGRLSDRTAPATTATRM